MPERSVALYPPEFGEAPLSLAFRQAWLEWRDAWDELEDADDSDGQLVERTAETATRIVRRLWRSAFASVGEPAAAQVKAMVYAFVALLDETLLFGSWAGQIAWQERPLEARLYGSRNAGERVPTAIRNLLKERIPATRDLANVYLQCLVLGFHGQLRGERGQAMHERWRQALFTFAWQREPVAQGALQSLERPLRAEPLSRPLRRALPDGLRLGLAIAGFALLLTALGQWLWSDIQSELEPVLHLAATLDDGEQSE
ncbi:DotU/TssL family secretion system protein [Pseudomonas sp. JS3066]|jgi:type VI secretion system protein ImpK|uniref:DotU family type IV/VI secretion system protein n=1 Tax=unclassified Pseudomonas TaxID=196821 RepID=UPI000EAA5888|nr:MULTISPECIES: DotU/TssL family secretion system protein [unclassified Pseudomonas]AYF87084.1 DotU family type IV/VI secretion system protein [Pseudomonas sp. DY-1]MDH4655419.1 DotU family type IV/VI secretion system protein [Pseudomonas sp. BN606]MRK22284.1 DotU family type IV/VI secretion system protein [Pseudomonas sp. JG-B]WVK95409.1 DotU/TssL family secretion system protein [Pseudomonas sp. JS3066]